MSFCCKNKRPFPCAMAAQSVIYSLRARGQDTERLTPYHCTRCNHWHLGHRERVVTPPPENALLWRQL